MMRRVSGLWNRAGVNGRTLAIHRGPAFLRKAGARGKDSLPRHEEAAISKPGQVFNSQEVFSTWCVSKRETDFRDLPKSQRSWWTISEAWEVNGNERYLGVLDTERILGGSVDWLLIWKGPDKISLSDPWENPHFECQTGYRLLKKGCIQSNPLLFDPR